MRPYIKLVVYGGALLAVGDPTHFTWWGVISLCLANLAQVLPTSPAYDYARSRTAMLAAITCTVIMAAVVVMSCTKCLMLSEALDEVGPWVYAGGNFALHYYPSLRALTLAHEYSCHTLSGDASRFLAAYCVLHQPDAVYGCGLPHAWLIAPLGILLMAACEYTAVIVCNRRQHQA
jgi:hypothetical protein